MQIGLTSFHCFLIVVQQLYQRRVLGIQPCELPVPCFWHWDMPGCRKDHHPQYWRSVWVYRLHEWRTGSNLCSDHLEPVPWWLKQHTSIRCRCPWWVCAIWVVAKKLLPNFDSPFPVLTWISKEEGAQGMQPLWLRLELSLVGLARSEFHKRQKSSPGIDGYARYYVTGAPQCPFPDAYLGSVINAVGFDALYVQVSVSFYLIFKDEHKLTYFVVWVSRRTIYSYVCSDWTTMITFP